MALWQFISIHALLAESDSYTTAPRPCRSNFYPRSPCGERRTTRQSCARRGYFYPRSPCGERRQKRENYCNHGPISIHALLAESDFLSPSKTRASQDFYPRSPCGERPDSTPFSSNRAIFLSTLSLRRATYTSAGCGRIAEISIHALLAESDCGHCGRVCAAVISIHALLAESDRSCWRSPRSWASFLSTLSLRRATGHRASRDRYKNYFYPRSPCGERRQWL